MKGGSVGFPEFFLCRVTLAAGGGVVIPGMTAGEGAGLLRLPWRRGSESLRKSRCLSGGLLVAHVDDIVRRIYARPPRFCYQDTRSLLRNNFFFSSQIISPK